ncbi:MAG: GLUG motif-containing protein, partial [Erysipelotrichaceae bacterium]|nr:GLUG motif-containing protein [Erysipelotrichaceae bacterium]
TIFHSVLANCREAAWYKNLSILLSSCILTNLCSIPVSADNFQVVNDQDMNPTNSTWGNDYETTNEFTISSAEDLFAFAAMVNSGKDFKGKTILLNQSITLTAENWIPIGTADIYDDRNIPNFAGTFDGQNNSISNLKLSYAIEENDPVYKYGGLFGYVTGTIKKLNLLDINLKEAYEKFGGIAGYLGQGGTIENCVTSGTISGATYDGELCGNIVGGIVGQSEGNITSCTNTCNIVNTTSNVGGIVGQMDGGNISNCQNTGSVEGYGYTGGIVGTLENSKISNCLNSGEIIGKDFHIDNSNRRLGGIAGDVTTVEITNCQNTGTVNADDVNEVGGVVGFLYYGSKVEGCSNSGAVLGDIKAGGIVGYAHSYSQKGYEVKNCQNEGTISGISEVGGVVGTSSSADKENIVLDVSNCTNSGSVIGTTNVGGIIGNHNSSEGIGVDAAAASVSGCINTGSVPEGAGAIVGRNNHEDTLYIGKVENNFWPEELGKNAVGSGTGSSSEVVDTVKNNSSYKPDGSLTTPISKPDGSDGSISNLGDAIEQIIGGGDTGTDVPETLKATVTYNSNGHGTNPNSETVTIGKSVTLPQMRNIGYYTFTGWSDGSKTYQAGSRVIVMKDIQFTAQWRNDTPSGGGGGGSSTSGTQFVKNAVYRAYNPNSGEHFYTPNYDEFKYITSIGWNDEGIACMTETKTSGHTLYRLYNLNSGLHHYTLDENEKNVLVSLGWKDEDVAWYTSKNENDPAVYRLYNLNDGQHHYTMDVKERDTLVKLGWAYEGVGYHTSPIKK